jgi:hypothetical protein
MLDDGTDTHAAPPPALARREPPRAASNAEPQLSDEAHRRLVKNERDKLNARARRAQERERPRKATGGDDAAPGPGHPPEGREAPSPPPSLWPKKEEVAAAEEAMKEAWSNLRDALHGTRYGDAMAPRHLHARVRHEDGREETVQVSVDPVAQLAKGTAPLAAKLLGKVEALTPTTMALLALGSVFGPPLLAHAKEIVSGIFSAPAEVGVGGGAP